MQVQVQVWVRLIWSNDPQSHPVPVGLSVNVIRDCFSFAFLYAMCLAKKETFSTTIRPLLEVNQND